MMDIYPRLLSELNTVRQDWRRQQTFRGVVSFAAVFLLAVVVVIGIDNLFSANTLGRVALAALFWGVLAWSALRLVWTPMTATLSDDFLAASIEQQRPDLGERLLSAVQLGREPNAGERPFVAALLRDANLATENLEWGDCLKLAWDRRWLAALICGVALGAGYATLRTPWFANGALRVLFPLAKIDPYTATRFLAIKPGDLTVPEGEAITIETSLAGALPVSASLFRSEAGGVTQLAPMNADDKNAGQFRAAPFRATSSQEYYLTAGDARSRVFRVEVVPRPKVENVGVQIEPPAYVGGEPRVIEAWKEDLAVLPGSKVTWTVTPSKPLREARRETVDRESTPAPLSESAGQTWTGASVVTVAGAKNVLSNEPLLTLPARVTFRLVDTLGYEDANPLARSLRAEKDQPPSFTIVKPSQDVSINVGDKLAIAFSGRDDFGLATARLVYRINSQTETRELKAFPDADGVRQWTGQADWDVSKAGVKPGDRIQIWAEGADRNNITGPGVGLSRKVTLYVRTQAQRSESLSLQMQDFLAALEELVRLQRVNKAETTTAIGFEKLLARQTQIRDKTKSLAEAMRKDAFPAATVVDALTDLAAGAMAEAVAVFEKGKASKSPDAGAQIRQESLPLQDRIIERLTALLNRLQKNEQAKKELTKLAKKDQPASQKILGALHDLGKGLDKFVNDQKELANKFEKMPKRDAEDGKEESPEKSKALEELAAKWGEWAKGTIDNLAKLPTGFVDDFGLRPDVNRVFEEIEKQATRSKAQRLDVPLEDLGAGLATEMLEDLELWMPDAADSIKWVQEEPLGALKIPEMPLPNKLEDLIGDLLQKEEEFDEEADDASSAWGDNLNQAGWGVADGPIASFSAKGKTGNDLPNNSEMTGRSGDGRRGKSSGQMVGDTARGLDGRKTPARLGDEKYEPGKLKEEGRQDPNGATGGGKKAGTGQRGLQGGAPPDFVKDMERLGQKQQGLKEKAEQIAQKLATAGGASRKLNEAIRLMEQSANDLRDLRYTDAARKRQQAIGELKSALGKNASGSAIEFHRTRELPANLREEMIQSVEERYPDGYESQLKNYYRSLAEAEK